MDAMKVIANKFQVTETAYDLYFYCDEWIIRIYDESVLNNYDFVMSLVENKIKLRVDLDPGPGNDIYIGWFPIGFSQFAQRWLQVFDCDITERVNDLLLIFHQNIWRITETNDTILKELRDFTFTVTNFVEKHRDKYDTHFSWWEFVLIDDLIRLKAIEALKELQRVYILGPKNLDVAKLYLEKDKDIVVDFLQNFITVWETNE
jgi:hypothetical protein